MDARRGALISHLSRTLTPDKDSDLLAGMLKTVQDFVRDAFSSHEDAPMRRIEFGAYNILMERGRSHWVAIVYRGKDSGTLEARLHRLSEQIDLEFGEVLEAWSGQMKEVRGIRQLLSHLWADEGLTLGALGGLASRFRELWPGGEKAEDEGTTEEDGEGEESIAEEIGGR